VTLRARLTIAFLAVALGPLVIGGVFVTAAAGSVDRSGDLKRLDVAANALRATMTATCDRLLAAAESAATITGAGAQVSAVQSIVDAGRASAVRIDGRDGAVVLATAHAPAAPWVLCAPAAVAVQTPSTGTAPGALAASVPIRDLAGRTTGYAYAAQTLDAAYLHRLSAAVGATVTVAGNQPVGSTDNTYVRTVAPIAGEPLEIAVSVPGSTQAGVILVVIGVILFAGVAAMGGARALARATLRPLDEVARAADRIAAGALQTRVPVRRGDEVGQVGAAFNRMTHEMRSYADALTASRDQLRGNLDVLGATLSNTHDRAGILRVILAAAITATGASRGVVLMPTAQAMTPTDVSGGASAAVVADVSLTVQCSEGFEDTQAAGLASLAVMPGAGLLGTVAATGIARRGRVTDPATELDSGEPLCATYLAVPLPVPPADAAATHGPAVTDAMPGGIGVLALYDRIGGGDFDTTDLHTVRTFARHAAVAVDNVRRHDEAQRLSHTDPLTGLYNYRHLQDTIGREINRSARFGHSMCVLMLDLDRFKDVNDTYGHAAGDLVLAEFARRISRVIRGVDLAFRIGGEEFVLLLPETVAAGGEVLAKRVGSAIRDHPMTVPDALRATADLMTVEMPLVGRAGIDAAASEGAADSRASAAVPTRHIAHIPITVSIGVAVFPDHGDLASDVLEAADAALYAAKSAGRDTYRIAAAPAGRAPEEAVRAPKAAVPASDPAAPAQRADHDTLINGAERSDGTVAEVNAVDRAGGASTAGPPPRAPIGR
jgi:two-component system, cell cycle response regulator